VGLQKRQRKRQIDHRDTADIGRIGFSSHERELLYGRQRLVEFAIALGLKPEVLLLDEPAAGVPSAESHIILDAIDGLPKHIGVLIIDHDMDLVFRFAHRITVMVSGAVFASGSPQEIRANPDVRAVYLGRAGHG
jgi:branched-chain amino acid transport system ATP-binding protein